MVAASPLTVFLRRYGIDEVHGFAPLTEGLLNRSYRVDTDQGSLFLKHYLTGSTATIGAQHRATAELAAAGLPVVAPLPTLAGETVARHGGRSFALYPWIDGGHRHGLDLTLRQAEDLGALLGRVHGTLAARLAPWQQQPMLVPVHPAARALATADHLLALVRARVLPDAFDELAEFRLLERKGMLVDLAHRQPAETEVPTHGLVHGDFHPLNTLYQGDRFVAVIDWDRLAVAPYVDEVVRAAVLYFIDERDGWLDLHRVRAFAAGYAAVRPEAAAEFPLGVHRLWWERLTDFWMLTWRYRRGDGRCDPQFPAAAALVVWWTEAYDKVLEAFT
jgi:Ser/Thr protein kinase RdoA (MazF antagonist)